MSWARELGAASLDFLKEGARLTPKRRARVPRRDLGDPRKPASESGSYPMPDKAHARAAVGLVEMHHPGSALAARVRAKAHALYPDVGEGGD